MEDVPRKESRLQKGKETILIIADEKMIVDIGAQMLEGLGYSVQTATGGRKGINLFEQYQEKIDLVILDMIMPDIGGKETFETLLRLKPSVKVPLSSGYSLDNQAKNIISEG
jgi:two-component system, cell cycle sensor histidine kinase and response regulator CckA